LAFLVDVAVLVVLVYRLLGMLYMTQVSYEQVHQYPEIISFREVMLSSLISLGGFHGQCRLLFGGASVV